MKIVDIDFTPYAKEIIPLYMIFVAVTAKMQF